MFGKIFGKKAKSVSNNKPPKSDWPERDARLAPFKELIKEAESGDMDAQYELAMHHLKDYYVVEEFYLYTKEITIPNNISFATYECIQGDILKERRKWNAEQARIWLEKAARQGHKEAQEMLK